MQEIVTYRMTSPEREAAWFLMINMFRSQIPSLPNAESCAAVWLHPFLKLQNGTRGAESISMFEIGQVFEPNAGDVPLEPRRLALVMTGKRAASALGREGFTDV